MNTGTGWNMHSVIEVAPLTETDTKVAAAIDVLSVHVPEWLDHPTTNFSTLKTITTSPRAELSHLRGLADKLGFLLMPFAYLDPQSYAEESKETQQAIRGFTDELSSKFLLYVLCPLEYYNLQRHMETKEDLPIHVPQQYAQAFMALDMCLPIFRNMRHDISSMREDITALSRKLEMNIRAQQERTERERMRLRDPMLFAVPKDKGIQGYGLALIGPAWGPDIEDILLQSYNLTTKPMQRKRIEESVQKLFGNKPVLQTRPPQPLSRPVDIITLREVTQGESAVVREEVQRFLEGDYSVMVEPPPRGSSSYQLSDLTRATRIARLGVAYLQRFHLGR